MSRGDQNKHLEKAICCDWWSPAPTQNLSKIYILFLCVCLGGGRVFTRALVVLTEAGRGCSDYPRSRSHRHLSANNVGARMKCRFSVRAGMHFNGCSISPSPGQDLTRSPGSSGLSCPLSSLHSTQVPKVKTVLTCSPSGEGSRPRRRYCPFRVRFADETLQDTALRYWERNRAGEHTATSGTAETPEKSSQECRVTGCGSGSLESSAGQ